MIGQQGSINANLLMCRIERLRVHASPSSVLGWERLSITLSSSNKRWSGLHLHRSYTQPSPHLRKQRSVVTGHLISSVQQLRVQNVAGSRTHQCELALHNIGREICASRIDVQKSVSRSGINHLPSHLWAWVRDIDDWKSQDIMA